VRRLLIWVGAAASIAWIGVLGAWAFNPDDGAVVHSELLWRVFGVAAELAVFATPLLLIGGGAVVFARFGARRCRARHARTS
jgi:hypothetical protein